MLYATNKDAAQPVHPHSLISAFVVRCLDNTSSFYTRNFKTLPSFCGCAGQFESTLVAIPEDRFFYDEAHLYKQPHGLVLSSDALSAPYETFVSPKIDMLSYQNKK